jgi:hypothetical protein
MIRTKQILALGLLLASVYEASALNYDPYTPAPAPVLDDGWAYDQINDDFTDSVDSTPPYSYNLAAEATFSIADSFNTGDTYFVYDFGSLILTTSVTPGGQPFESLPFEGSAAHSWGSVLLSAGAHQITVQGDGVSGIPAGFYTRLDSASVPDASTTASLLGLGFVALAGVRRFVNA